jgi:hypothetical protein
LASDGRYYPPELAPGSTNAAVPSTAPKKKVVKKKVAAKAPGAAPTASSAARPAKKKIVKKKAVAKAVPADPTVDLTEKRPGHLKYTAKPPPSDQVAARRIQAKEQMVLLAGARQTAALRLLANLGEPAEPVLVGVGGRDLDARSHAGETAAPSAPASSSTATLPAAPPSVLPDGPSGPVDPPGPTPAPPTASTPPTAPVERVEDPPAEAPMAETPLVDETPAPAVDEAPVPAVDDDAPPPPPPPADETVPETTEIERPAPHQPEVGPAPAPKPMGTDVPFMEVKGSALGTDIDRIGEKILIYADRVELRDRTNGVRQSIRYDQLAAVEVQKKMMGPTLLITSVAGGTMTAKALRPELATGAKAMIEKHAARFRGEDPAPPADDHVPPPPPPAPAAEVADAPTPGGARTHRSVLTAMLDELHAAGILSPEEMEQKRALIERNDRA